MTQQGTSSEPPIRRVTVGMTVLDRTGTRVGTVDLVQRGDPDAVTVQAPGTDPGSSLDELIEAATLREPDVPADLAARLLHTGYLKVVGPDGAVYVRADQIATVEDQHVLLAVPGTTLTPEE